MSIAATAEHQHTVKEQIADLFVDLEKEAERELHRPHDFSESDHLVQRHIDGLAISFFVLISLFLIGAITAIALH